MRYSMHSRADHVATRFRSQAKVALREIALPRRNRALVCSTDVHVNRKLREGNMISSAEGFKILGNWKSQKTRLWLAVQRTENLQGPEVRIVEVSREPDNVVFDLGEGEKLEPLDLKDARFDKSDSAAAQFPRTITKRFGFFLNLSLPDGREFVLAQPVQ